VTTKLTEQRVDDRRGTLWQIAVLDVRRLLVRSGTDHRLRGDLGSTAAEGSR
jgi:hypothetical protein